MIDRQVNEADLLCNNQAGHASEVVIKSEADNIDNIFRVAKAIRR